MCKAARERERRRAGPGFTLSEVALVIVILAVLGVVLFLILAPILFKAKPNGRPRTGLTPPKQIALAFLQYMQDYDDTFPPGAGGIAYDAQGRPVRQSWGPDRPLGGGKVLPGLISAYVKGPDVFRGYKEYRILGLRHRVYLKNTPAYLYNDLLIGQKHADLVGAANTVLTTDGEDQPGNVGHAWLPDAGPFDTTFTASGKAAPGGGATVRTAPLRWSGGGNYAFTDGHVKWHKAGAIYFPPRDSDSPLHRAPGGKRIGPDPARDEEGKSTPLTFQGRSYSGTFHVR